MGRRVDANSLTARANVQQHAMSTGNGNVRWTALLSAVNLISTQGYNFTDRLSLCMLIGMFYVSVFQHDQSKIIEIRVTKGTLSLRHPAWSGTALD